MEEFAGDKFSIFFFPDSPYFYFIFDSYSLLQIKFLFESYFLLSL